MRSTLITFLGLVLACGSNILYAGGHNDHIKARRLVEEGEILPLEQILERAKLEHPGRILDVEFEKEDGLYVYEIELVDQDGQVWELEYNAANAELIEKEKEN
jgi:uncharacterized membrane protein YkoI